MNDALWKREWLELLLIKKCMFVTGRRKGERKGWLHLRSSFLFSSSVLFSFRVLFFLLFQSHCFIFILLQLFFFSWQDLEEKVGGRRERRREGRRGRRRERERTWKNFEPGAFSSRLNVSLKIISIRFFLSLEPTDDLTVFSLPSWRISLPLLSLFLFSLPGMIIFVWKTEAWSNARTMNLLSLSRPRK